MAGQEFFVFPPASSGKGSENVVPALELLLDGVGMGTKGQHWVKGDSQDFGVLHSRNLAPFDENGELSANFLTEGREDCCARLLGG